MPFYPRKIDARLQSLGHAGTVAGANATGTAASFECGSLVRLSLRIDFEDKRISEAKFRTNGCGYMIAAADVLAEQMVGRKLTELHGLTQADLDQGITAVTGEFPEARKQCSEFAAEALRKALSDYRSSMIEEFQGEKALICTCFGISEETIAKVIEENAVDRVIDVTEICNAGRGCGSCQMIIQEMIDEHRGEII